MGKLRDQLLATATREPWLLPENRKIAKAKPPKATSWPLPKPYNRPNGEHERDILRAILAELRRLGCVAERIDVQGKILWSGDGEGRLVSTQMVGLPDIIGCKEGRFLALEVKRPGGRVSGDQIGALQRLQASGALVCLACGTGELAAWLEGWEPEASLMGIPVLGGAA